MVHFYILFLVVASMLKNYNSQHWQQVAELCVLNCWNPRYEIQPQNNHLLTKRTLAILTQALWFLRRSMASFMVISSYTMAHIYELVKHFQVDLSYIPCTGQIGTWGVRNTRAHLKLLRGLNKAELGIHPPPPPEVLIE